MGLQGPKLLPFYLLTISMYYSMKNKGELDLWDKEAVKQWIHDNCPELTTGEGDVYYCTQCMSLFVKNEGFVDVCGHCGSTDIEKTSMRLYDELYKQRFGKKLFNLD